MDAKRIHWYDGMSQGIVREGFARASGATVDGWDGYYAQVAIAEGVNTVLTVDEDFDRFDAFDTEVSLSSEQYRGLNEFLRG